MKPQRQLLVTRFRASTTTITTTKNLEYNNNGSNWIWRLKIGVRFKGLELLVVTQ